MKKRLLGRTGLLVSEIGFGTWAMGGQSYGPVRDEDSLEALNAAESSGVTFYDTADTYGEGHSESLLGRFLKTKPREQMIVATKVGWDFYHAGHKKNFDPQYVRWACEQSLRRLDIATIDLYQLHNPSLEILQRGDAVGVLEGLKAEGKIRFVGISIHAEAEALAALNDSRIDVLQVIFNLLDQRMAEKVFPEAKKKNVGIIAREPLAHGLLSGKYPPNHEFPKDDHRRRWMPEKRKLDWEKIRKIREILKEKTIPLSQAALEYALGFDAVSVIIPGAKTETQVAMNLKASLKPELIHENIKQLRRLYEKEPLFRKGLIPK